jgi:predicted MFS family arabinose efflux permease
MHHLRYEYLQHIDSQDPRKFTERRKWLINLVALAVLFWANALSSMIAPAVERISSDLHVSTPAGRVIQAIYLYGVAIGAVVLTPLSEGKCLIQVEGKIVADLDI